jgi:hypothetical protein
MPHHLDQSAFAQSHLLQTLDMLGTASQLRYLGRATWWETIERDGGVIHGRRFRGGWFPEMRMVLKITT